MKHLAKSLIVPKKTFSSKNTLSQAEMRYESGMPPFDQMKVSEKTHGAKKKLTKYDKVLQYG